MLKYMQVRYCVTRGGGDVCALYPVNFIYAVCPLGGGDAVAQLVKALRYKPEGRGFDSR